MDAAVRTPPPPPPAAGDDPRDARVVRSILRSLGLRDGEYDAGVVCRFVQLIHRYAGDVLGEAMAYADHAGRASLDAEDVLLAIEAKAAFSPGPPRREVIFELARSRNTTPLPMLTAPPGSIRLPPLQDIMLRQNYLLVRPVKPSPDQVEETEDDDEGSDPTFGTEEIRHGSATKAIRTHVTLFPSSKRNILSCFP
ncbi:hypothetical protein ACP70R_005390 [Stipagrostis hirtigluma subsp. patula]